MVWINPQQVSINTEIYFKYFKYYNLKLSLALTF